MRHMRKGRVRDDDEESGVYNERSGDNVRLERTRCAFSAGTLKGMKRRGLGIQQRLSIYMHQGLYEPMESLQFFEVGIIGITILEMWKLMFTEGNDKVKDSGIQYHIP